MIKFMNEHPDWIILDNSQNAEYGACPERYNHRYNRGVHGTNSAAAEFGKWMVHEPFEHWYSHGMNDAAMPSDVSWSNWWYGYQAGITGQLLKPNENLAYQPANAKQALLLYVQQYAADEGMYKVLHTESVFWATLPDLEGVVWLSKPDLVLELIASGGFMTVDIKSSVWANGENLIPFDRQFVGQAYATGSSEMMKIFIRFEVQSGQRGVRVHVSRQRVKLEEETLHEWVRDTIHDAKTIMESHRSGVWPKRAPRACHEFNRLCEMYSLCENGRKQADKTYHHMLRSNPLEYLGLSQDKNGKFVLLDAKHPKTYIEHKQRLGKTAIEVPIGQQFSDIEIALPEPDLVDQTSVLTDDTAAMNGAVQAAVTPRYPAPPPPRPRVRAGVASTRGNFRG